MNHIYVHTKEKPFSCKICRKPFQARRDMKVHQLVHTKKKEHKCPECPAAFGINYSLQHHIRSVHRKILPHKCPLCDKAFAIKSNLTSHFNVHSNEKPYKCEKCGAGFSQKCNMRKHLKRHDLVAGKFWCSKCTTNYPNMLVFQRHYLEMHAGINANVLQCIFCEKEFSRWQSLEQHILAHINEKPSA
ncbi:putative zinc finger protein [Orchesella cincta]|uniref:Putative zinc finger protein n=1 Tax=Orchesella cincta TaxID=48709 RepID=A0A1D2M3D3_ORCCI|nr:putative zinc finger protein [Orchesella cincta]